MKRLLVFLFLAAPLFAQVPVTLNPYQRQQFFDVNGHPLAGGCIFTYQAGTSTPLATYTDNTGLFQNTNPLILDSAGEGVMWLSANAYKFVLFSNGGVNCASGTQQWTVDFISPPPFLSGNNNWTGSNTFNGLTTFNFTAVFNSGGSMAGVWTGTPNFTGNVTFSGNPQFTGSPNFVNATPVWNSTPQLNLNPEMQSIVLNNSVSGTLQADLVKLTGAPSTGITPLVTDTVGAVGICIANCGTSSSATVQNIGTAVCNFDAATTAGDYVVFSALVAGECHDVPGGGYPSSGQVMGRVLSTNVTAGPYFLNLFASEDRSSVAAATFPTVVYSVASASTNANIGAVTMATVGANSATYRFAWYMTETVIGASCSGNTTVAVNTIWQDPLDAGARTTVTTMTLANLGNGTVGEAFQPSGSGPTGNAGTSNSGLIRAKAGTAIQYSTTYTIGSGCSPGPSYQLFPILEQITAN